MVDVQGLQVSLLKYFLKRTPYMENSVTMIINGIKHVNVPFVLEQIFNGFV